MRPNALGLCPVTARGVIEQASCAHSNYDSRLHIPPNAVLLFCFCAPFRLGYRSDLWQQRGSRVLPRAFLPGLGDRVEVYWRGDLVWCALGQFANGSKYWHSIEVNRVRVDTALAIELDASNLLGACSERG